MKYIEFVNSLIRREVIKPENIVLYGQNIAAGSCLGGLTKGLVVREGGRIINTTNSENTLVGMGFGLMLGGASGVFFMKQMDFLLLGVDQLVNTYNIIRSIKHQNPKASFTIVANVVDSGYEGPQSALNNFADFCSVARVPGFTVTNKVDAEKIFSSQLVAPGFRIIGVSQRLSKNELIDPGNPVYTNENGTVFQYSDGKDVTVASFNFSFPQAWELCKELERNGLQSSFFNINSPTPTDWREVVKSAAETKKLVLIDDSKSVNLACDALAFEIYKTASPKKLIVVKRELKNDWFYPTHDIMEIDGKSVAERLKN